MINKYFAIIILACSISIKGNAQLCTPNPAYANESFGVWPDTTENLPCAFADLTTGFNTVIDIKTLTDTTASVEIAGAPFSVNASIEAFRVNGVTGLPSGFTYVPNQAIWTNAGTAPNFTAVQGCVSILASQATLQSIITNSGGAGADFPLIVVVDAKIHSTDNTLANTFLAGRWLSEVNTAGIEAIPVTGYTLRVRPTSGECLPLSISNEANALNSFRVEGNFPNPFHRSTEIRYLSPKKQQVEIKVQNMVGRLVTHKIVTAERGSNKFSFNAEQLSPGIYFYTVQAGNETITRKMIVSAH